MKGKIKYIVNFIFIVFFFTIIIGIVDDMNTTPKVKGDIEIWVDDKTYNYLSEAAEKFMAINNKSNIKVTKVYEYEYLDKLNQSFDSKSLPSILQVPSDNLDERILNKKNRSYNQIENSIINDYSKKFTKGRLEEVTYDGMIFAIPLTSRPLILYLREDMLNVYGYRSEDINTWSDVIDMGKDIYIKSGGKVKVLNGVGSDYNDIISLLIMQTLEELEVEEDIPKEIVLNKVKEKLDNLITNNILNNDLDGEFLARISSINGMAELLSLDVECEWVAKKVPAIAPGGNRLYVAEGENLVVLDESEENKELIRRFIGYIASSSDFSTKYIQRGDFFLSYLSSYRSKVIEEPIKNFSGESPIVTMANVAERAPNIKDYNLYKKVKNIIIKD